jgi:hypothetical protein
VLDHFYKLGAAQAVRDFTGWLDGGVDNPTAAPPTSRYTKTAVERMVEKLAKPKKRSARSPIYTPTKGTKFKAMVGKLKKKKTSRRK